MPTVVDTNPADSDVGIPVGTTIKVYFDTGVDLETVKDSIALFGRDFDFTSGPDSAQWINSSTGENNFFLNSPGFNGLIPLKIELAYYTLGTTTEVTPTITSAADEVSENVGHVAKITVDPKFNPSLPADTLLTCVINGDPDSQNIGISRRTIFDVEAGGGNAGNGNLFLAGTYLDEGMGLDTINIKITTAGTTGTAEFKWWFDSAGEGSAILRQRTTRKFRTLGNGIQVRFTGTDHRVNDLWSFNVETISRMEENFTISFTTNDGNYSTAPSTASTPAASTPPSTTLSPYGEEFEVLSMVPENRSYNVTIKNRKIVIKFSDDVDPDTITNENIKLWQYPVSGVYDNTYSPKELQKKLEVSDDTLTITF
jgi:hypothetical protein